MFHKKAFIPEKNRKCRLICSMTPRSCYVVTSPKIKVKGTVAGLTFYVTHFPVSQLRRVPWCNNYDTERCEWLTPILTRVVKHQEWNNFRFHFNIAIFSREKKQEFGNFERRFQRSRNSKSAKTVLLEWIAQKMGIINMTWRSTSPTDSLVLTWINAPIFLSPPPFPPPPLN